MTDFNGAVGSGAIKHITGMGNLAVIDDNTDSMHTGIIQYLNAAAAGNHVVDGMTIAQSDGGTYTTFTVAAGSYFKNHVLQSFSEASVSLSSSFDPAAFTYYIFLVVNSSGSLALRGNESDGASETDVGNLSDGDIPIALIEINKSSAADATDRKIQHFGATAKGRGFSVTDTNGDEVLQLKIDGTLVNSGGTLTLPSATDTLVGKATTDTLTNKTISGSSNTLSNIPTSALASSTFTISDGSNTSPVALSETLTIQGTNNEVDVVENNKTVTIGLPSTITANVTGNVTGDVTGNADTATTATTATNITVSANNSTDETVFPLFVDGATGGQGAETDTGLTYNPSTGMLTATGFTGALTGNASTATALANARNFSITGDITANAISFDGTGAVALSATIDNNSVALGTKTTGSYVAQGATSGNGISGAVNTEGGTFTVTSNATNANTASTIVFRDSNGDFSAGTISAALTGNVTGNVTGTVSSLSNHDTGDLAEGTNKYLTLANLKSQLNASMPSNALTIGDSDDTITIPGSLVVTGTTTTASVETVSTSNGVVFEGSTADNNETTLVGGNPSGDITITLPTTAGTVALTTSDISGNAATATQWANARTITLGTDLSGSVSIDGTGDVTLNATIVADSVALGTDTTGNYVTSITNGSFLTGGNGGSEGAALTLAVDATNLNTASKVVARDSSGNFSAGTITATLSGNASTATQVANLNNLDTGDLSEGSNLYHTTERVQDVVGGQFVTNGSHTNITAAYDDSGDGAIDLSITDATIRGKISVTDSGGDGSLAYNNGTGVITYTGPSASEVRAHISAGTGVGISSGEISIGQAVATNSNVQFGTINGTTITGSSIVKSGGSSSEFLKADGSVDSSTYLTAHPNISGASTVSASTATFIDGLTIDGNGHVTATSTSTALIGVTDGNLIDTSTTNGNVTIAVDLSELADMTQSVDRTQDELVILDNGSQKRKLISEIPISALNNDGSALNPANFSEKTTAFDHDGGTVSNEDTFIISDIAASGAGKRILASNIPLSAFDNTATGFTSNVGDITAIVSGTGLTGGNTSGSITLDVDLSELTTSTSDGDGDFFIVVDSLNAQKKLTKGNINLSGFNNDLGITPNATHTGDVTGATALTIADDAVTYAKMQNVSATNRLLGRDSAGAGIIEEIAPADVLTMLGVESGATADQTGAEIKTALFNESDTNNLTDTLLSKLNAIEASATADQTASEIRTLVESASDSNVFTDADHSKLNAIEASADVTDTDNVTAAGALMDSEITNLAQVKAFDSSDYATAAQGTTADAALARSGGQMTGNITFSSTQTVDGRDLSVDGAKLDGIEANATADQTASEITALLNDVASYSLGTTSSGTITVNNDMTVAGNLTVTGTTTTTHVETTTTSNGVVFEGSVADANELTLKAGTVSADRTITLPDATGTVLLTDGSGASLTALNGSQITSGTVAAARIGALAASKITSGTFADARIAESNVTQHQAAINHDSLAGFVAAEHVDWAGSSAGTIHSTNIPTLNQNTTGTAAGLSATLAVSSGGTGSATAPMVGVITAANAGAARTVLGLGAAAVKTVATDGSGGVSDGEAGLVTGNAVFDYIAAQNFSSSGASNFVIGDITGQTALTSGLASTDELVLNDAGVLKRMDISVLQSYMQSNLTFTTDTNTQLSNAQVVSALNSDLGGDIVFGTQTDDNVKYTGTISVGNVDAAGSAKITADGFASMNGLFLGYGAGPGYIKTYNSSDNLELYAHSGSAHVKMIELDAVNSNVNITGNITVSGSYNLASGDIPNNAADTSGNAATATLATTVTVSDSTANTNFPVVFHNESNGLLDDTGALRYNPSTGTLLVPNLSVAGTTTTVDTVTMEAANAIVFEGATADAYETTLTITDPTADRTITLPNASGTVAVSAGTGIDLSAAGAVSVDVSDFMTNGSNNRILTATGTDAMNAEANLTFDGSTLALTGDLNVGSGDFFVDDSAGKVGIGTTSPESKLEVVAALAPSSATQFTYVETLKLDVEDSGTAEGPAIRFRHGATNDHNAADYMFQVNGDGGSAVSHEYTHNYNFRKWHHASGDDGFKPIMRFKASGSTSASGTQYGEIILTSTATAWDVYDGTHTGLEPSTYDTQVKLSGGEVSYINNGQNFGIGTTSPGHKLEVNGSFAATTKSFDIEHPTKEGMRLHHGSLEGPEHGVYIRGRLEGDVVELPDYWLGLVDEDTITVQLTPNRGFQQIYVEDISDNKVYVGTQTDTPIDCFYFIQAERKDVDKMEVEY